MGCFALGLFFLQANSPVLAATDARCAALVRAFGKGMPTTVSPSGLRYRIVKPGAKKPIVGSVAIGHYVVCLTNGSFLDATPKGRTYAFTIGAKQVIAGTEQATQLIGVGGEILVDIPYNLAYGEKGRPPAVPPRSDLLFDIRLSGLESIALSTKLQLAYDVGGIPAMKDEYAHSAAIGFAHMYAGADDLDALGYRFLKKHLPAPAIVIFKDNLARFPDVQDPTWWNGYESLGDAYRAAGDTARAIANYRRALQFDPTDQTLQADLKQLEQPKPDSTP